DYASKGGYNLLAISWAIILLAAIDGRWLVARIMTARPLLALGRLSYGIYLWHVPIQFAVADHTNHLPPLVRFAIANVLLAVAVVLSWKFVEEPIIRYKDRLEGKKSL